MRSVGTRTTPNGPLVAAPPPASARRRLDDRSFSAERIPSTKTKGVSADEHSYNAERDFHANAERAAAAHNANRQQTLNGERLVSNGVFANGARRGGHRRGESLDLCGNNIVLNIDKNGSHQAPPQPPRPSHKDKSKAKPDNHNPPNIQPVSGKLEHAQVRQQRPCSGAGASFSVFCSGTITQEHTQLSSTSPLASQHMHFWKPSFHES